MDLEELKKQWDGLSEQLKKQQVLNHSLINRAMNTKMDSIMRYNLIGISCCVLYILLAIFAPPTIFSRLVTIYLNIVIPFAGIWQCLSFGLFLKMRHYRNNITTMEHYLIRYEKCEKLNYVVQYIIVMPFVVLFLLQYNNQLVTPNLDGIPFWAILVFLIFVLFSSVLGTMWYFKKIKNLKQCIRDLKEFEEE